MAIAAIGDCLRVVGDSSRLKVVRVLVAIRAFCTGEVGMIAGRIAPVVLGRCVANFTDAVVHGIAVGEGVRPRLTQKYDFAPTAINKVVRGEIVRINLFLDEGKVLRAVQGVAGKASEPPVAKLFIE